MTLAREGLGGASDSQNPKVVPSNLASLDAPMSKGITQPVDWSTANQTFGRDSLTANAAGGTPTGNPVDGYAYGLGSGQSTPPTPIDQVVYTTEYTPMSAQQVPDQVVYATDAPAVGRADQAVDVDYSAAANAYDTNVARQSVAGDYVIQTDQSMPMPQQTGYVSGGSSSNYTYNEQTNQSTYSTGYVVQPDQPAPVSQEPAPVRVREEKIQQPIEPQAPPLPPQIIVVRQPAQPVNPVAQKPSNNQARPVFPPPAVPKSGRNISSVLSGMQPGIKPNSNQNQSGGGSGSTLSRDTSGVPSQQDSLGDHLARLQRGGGRIIPKGKDILAESDMPPEQAKESQESEESEDKKNT